MPGCVHTDLLASGLIDDPLIDRNDESAQWIGHCDWRYTCIFDAPPDLDASSHLDLVCEGLDTIATIQLNGMPLGEAANMHVRHRFDVRDRVLPGRNVLIIEFAAPVPYVERMAERYGHMPHAGEGSNPPLPHNMMRKSACNFGWDWGPALPGAGVWRPIYLEAWSGARLAGVRPGVVQAEPSMARVAVSVDLQRSDPHAAMSLACTLRDPDGLVVARQRVDIPTGVAKIESQFDLASPRLWWPVGYGEQPLYQLTLRLLDDSDSVLDRWAKPIGLRTLELVTTEDPPPPGPEPTDFPAGSTFHLRINGQRIFCKGANWIPDDCFPSRMTPDRYHRRVSQAREANMNMLRVWGGGIYEDHAFYDACDQMGVMVWQDFCCACAAYPEDKPFAEWFEQEARDNVTRLGRHASLVLWCGNNECQQAVEAWGKFERHRGPDAEPWGDAYYTDLFPRVVSELDPTRPYWPGSPYSPTPGTEANAEHEGDAHIWDVWNGRGDARNYLSHTPRFASEFGFHGPPTWPTLARAIPEDQRRYDAPTMIHHNRHAGGQQLAHRRLGDVFNQPHDFDDWHYLAQVLQARSLALGVEWFRALSPRCSGTLYWQFNDCWPVSSWSAIDGEGRRKPLWYATRRFLAPRLLTIRPNQATPQGTPIGQLAVYLHNDECHNWQGSLVVHQIALDGQAHQELFSMDVDVETRGVFKIVLPEELARTADTFLMAQIEDERCFWFFAPDRDIAYPSARINATLVRRSHDHRLTLRAGSLVRDLCIFADRLDPEALVSDQLLTLLPGEETTITIQSNQNLKLEDLTRPPVMQSVNRHGLRS